MLLLMKTYIDLMPLWAVKAKARRRLIIILTIIQLAIFLLLGMFILHVNVRGNQVREHYRELSAKIVALDNTPSLVAEELHIMRELYDYIKEITDDGFDSEWLRFVMLSLPHNAEFFRIDYGGNEMTLVAATADLTVVGQHREILYEFFEDVTLVRVSLNDGIYVYEIRVG